MNWFGIKVAHIRKKEVISILKRCPFYRDSETFSMGRGLGHCDLYGQITCEGEIQFCQNPRELRIELSKQRLNEIVQDKGAEGKDKNPRHYKVLVVDDQEQLRKLVVAFLSRQGHQCETAANGIEALNIMQKDKFDAVIADIVMPKMDGITLTKELLHLYPNLPIMVMTGHSREFPTNSAISVGARDFIEKPFSQEGLILRFNKMMSDHEILMKIKEKQKEILLQMQAESSDKENELRREIESLKGKLYEKYSRLGDKY